jgi:hypothetical protein
MIRALAPEGSFSGGGRRLQPMNRSRREQGVFNPLKESELASGLQARAFAALPELKGNTNGLFRQ